ncbi:MAG TPA: hypothetical protein VFG42_16490 [Baekduia sp.]|uniref:hypothetical protein n=1 Tax=Baekduia sp. TaxID=2600305 RepID=UPI002D782840|nr:hypothetical protein [Baekduia sp.]HET6508394.1 hypothetical protein [Baekduia sp.]
MTGPDPDSPTPEPAYVDPAPEPAEAVAQAPIPPAADPPAEPTPTVPLGDATFAQPAGSALLGGAGGEVDPHPEKLVGAAFAGGLVAALFLKGMARRKHS